MDDFEFDIFGFHVRVLPAFLFVIGIYALFSLQSQQPMWTVLIFGAVFFVSILVHELGHAFAARALGMRVGDIRIHGFGGDVTHSRSTPRNQLLVSLAGPAAGLTLGVAAVGLSMFAPPIPAIAVALSVAVWINIVWSLFNLLPMWPLDGGHATESALTIAMGARRSATITHRLGLLIGVLIAALGLMNGMIFVAFIGGQAAWQNWNRMQELA